jgi:microtubule-associated protein, RP/EB family
MGERQEIVQEYQKATADLTTQISTLKVTVEQVEKEREFYFSKV